MSTPRRAAGTASESCLGLNPHVQLPCAPIGALHNRFVQRLQNFFVHLVVNFVVHLVVTFVVNPVAAPLRIPLRQGSRQGKAGLR